jgi:hypothetical protein
MTEMLTSASYIQNREILNSQEEIEAALQSIHQHDDTGVAKRVWQLLETPQTVASLARAVASEYDIEPADCIDDIRVSLSTLYREELIQLSPDT